MFAQTAQTFLWILFSGLLMSAIALIGLVVIWIPPKLLDRMLIPLVAFAAGSLLAGALFFLLPESIDHIGNRPSVYIWLVVGFLTFYIMEQFLHWHHCHHATHHQPLTYLVLLSDAVHNFIGGMAVGGSFMVDIRVGLTAWVAAAMHEIPQELGDYGILIHGGWEKRKALLFNFLTALTFPLGGITVFFMARVIDVSFLLPFAAGNFLYIAAVDLVPEIKNHDKLSKNLIHFVSFVAGMGIILLTHTFFGHSHA
jgi:zinc and cadmium transporter